MSASTRLLSGPISVILRQCVHVTRESELLRLQANQRSGSGLDGGVGGGVDQDVDEGGSPGGGLDDLTGFFPELLTPFAPTSPSELLIAVVFATPSILFILYSGQLDFLVPLNQKPPTQIL